MSQANITYWYTVRDAAIERSLETRPKAYERFHGSPSVICECGENFHVHEIHKQRATRSGCKGFVAAKVLWRETRTVEVEL